LCFRARRQNRNRVGPRSPNQYIVW
jgi:hypothetical protein